MEQKTCSSSVTQKPSPQGRQLQLFPPSSKLQSSPYLQIEHIPAKERIDLKEDRYKLKIQPQGIRACGGQFTRNEIDKIAQATKGWDWALDPDGRPHCLPKLELVLDTICRDSALKGGEA